MADFSKNSAAIELDTQSRHITFRFADDSRLAQLGGVGGFQSHIVFTVGDKLASTQYQSGYQPPGLLDGAVVFTQGPDTVRILVNHEIKSSAGSFYTVNSGSVEQSTVAGARISFLDLDRYSLAVKNSGIAYDDVTFEDGSLVDFDSGVIRPLSRFCSGVLLTKQDGFDSQLYLTGEEDDSLGVGRLVVLDPVRNSLHIAESIGAAISTFQSQFNPIAADPIGGFRFENAAAVDTADPKTVGLLISSDGSNQPLYLWEGDKLASGNYLQQNGLAKGKLSVFVGDAGTPRLEHQGDSANGSWHLVAQSDGAGRISYSPPTAQPLLFDKLEDIDRAPSTVAVNRFVVAVSSGIQGNATTPAAPRLANQHDEGGLFQISIDFAGPFPQSKLTYLYSGTDDPNKRLRNPDNLEWSNDGYIYVTEDGAEQTINHSLPAIVQLDPVGSGLKQIAKTSGASNWESSGLIDISTEFALPPGSLFLANVQAHGERPAQSDLVEAGQMLLISRDQLTTNHVLDPAIDLRKVVASRYVDQISGASTDEIFAGRQRGDWLAGGAGNDLLKGQKGSDHLFGGNDSDNLRGGRGRDHLKGEDGADHLRGGAGVDKHWGGAGPDTFDFNWAIHIGKKLGNRDLIIDFEHGIDRIDFSDIDAKIADSSDRILKFFGFSVSTDGDQAFTFVETDNFSRTKGELRYHVNKFGDTIIAGDRDGNGRADFKLELTGYHILDSDDLIL